MFTARIHCQLAGLPRLGPHFLLDLPRSPSERVVFLVVFGLGDVGRVPLLK